MPLKSLFKRKRRNKTSSKRKDASDEYDPMMVEPEHAAQLSSKPSVYTNPKADSRSRFEAAKSVFNPRSTPKEHEARETSVTPEKISRFQPNGSRGIESGRDTSMHRVFPLEPQDSDEIDIDAVEDIAPKESSRTPQRDHQTAAGRKHNFDGFWTEQTLPHQRVGWTGSVVGFPQKSSAFGQKQPHDGYSAQSKSSSFSQQENGTAQYDEIDNRDYIIESDDESVEADESLSAGERQDQLSSNNFVSFGDNFFAGENVKQHDAGVFQSQVRREETERLKVSCRTTPQREKIQPRKDRQEHNINGPYLAATSSMDSYLLRGTESDSVLFGEDLEPSASGDFFAGLDPEEMNPSEHMSTSNSLLDNSLIDETSPIVESRQPDSRGDYTPSHFQDDFVSTVRTGWNYLEQSLSVDQDDSQGDLTKTIHTAREGWSDLEHSLSAKSVDSEFDDMVMTLRQSLSNISDNLSNQFDRALPLNTLVGEEALTNRQDDLLNTVINNMSFFNEDSTDEELEQEMFGAPLENSDNPTDVETETPKDPDEILDDVLENWSLTSDSPTSQNQEKSSELAKEEINDEAELGNENGFMTSVRQTLSYLTDDGDDNEEKGEAVIEEQESINENGFMTTLRQTLSYVTDDGANEEDENESAMNESYSTEVTTQLAAKNANESDGIIKSWSFFSAASHDDDESTPSSHTSSIGTISDDEESAVYQDELSVGYSDAPSDEDDEGLSIGGLSKGEGGMLDQVLDHWSYFAAATGIPEDLDEYDDFSSHSLSESDESTVVEERLTRSRKKALPKTTGRKKESRKSRRRKQKSSKDRRQPIPKTVFGTGDDSEPSEHKDLSPANGIVVDIPLPPLITHTTVHVSGQCAVKKTGQDTAEGQENDKSIQEEQVSSDLQSPSKTETSEVGPSEGEPDAGKHDEAIADSAAGATEANHVEAENEKPLSVEEGTEQPSAAKVDEPGEYGKMSADEESIESLGCATATENVSVQSIQDADADADADADVDDASEVVDADDVSEGSVDHAGMQEKTDDAVSVESAGTVSETSEDFDDEGSYSAESEYDSEYDSEYTGEFSDETSSAGPIKKSYSATSMKSAALERFGQPESKTDINTAAKVKSTKGKSGRVVDCQRSSKRSHRPRKKRTEGESEASQTHRRRLV